MRNNSYGGFMYEDEEELKGLIRVDIDEFLDLTYGKDSNSDKQWNFGCENLKWQDEDKNDYSPFEFYDTLSDHLYSHRTDYRGITQKEFAKELGVSVATLSKVENGNINVRRKTLAILKAYLGIE
ncbi:helix-turn-helix domain-containing protein [Guptibacillus hwajinpoensis]|uniref:helix-turn-helix domain-containing protein n=1 Tax=Guptibacillus hwajinpoensis TaxID=208199 RepID=UPI00373632C8